MSIYRYQFESESGYLDGEWLEMDANSHHECAGRAAERHQRIGRVFVHCDDDGWWPNGKPMSCHGFTIRFDV